ncbi:hypothetical protein L249_7737 [Ophiocordyceps polyrhachis-furcata BCC 54312]|uniref:Alpha-galactosidase n=1 Tax=Ophiocordyceps polyrhachis-furcata BCC 54312 TaxID=1330021 RepID=A0A367LBC8_9HYPO|nr:hypothetical protein L249_7737 [Ophiocordyceps polyrhachis-furcata BCC 54312]
MFRFLRFVAVTAAGLIDAVTSFRVPADRILPLPPMGFNNWARFQTDINESIFVDAAEVMTRNGLRAAGYNRINLDDAWSTMSRAADDSMVWDVNKFPRGLPWLAGHIKSKGFIPGIYTDSGSLSCGGYPGALGYEDIDLRAFTAWGFDFLKMDGCNLPDASEKTYHEVYGRWNNLLSQSGSRMVFSNSAPAYFSGVKNLTSWYMVMGWSRKYGHLARHSADIQTYPEGDSWISMMYNYGQHVRLSRYQKPGFFNDPDFLNVDHPSYSLTERKTHFALWCVLSAPLLLSTDLKALKDKEIEYLTNRRLIAVNQDSLVQQATLVSRDASHDVLSKSVQNGDRVVAVLNKGDAPIRIMISWERLGFSPVSLQKFDYVSAENLWTGKRQKLAVAAGGVRTEAIPSHGTAVYRLSQKASAITPTGLIFNSNSLKCLGEDWSGVVGWYDCNDSDSQVWMVRRDGRISSLLHPDGCLMHGDVNLVYTANSPGQNCGKWTYHVSGNLINSKSGYCLTERANGVAVVASCGYLLNEQVLSLPIGVEVVGA